MAKNDGPLTPRGVQNSIKNRAQAAAAKTPGATSSELQDLYFHRRLLARVFHADPNSWVLKGGQALLVRWPAARYSTDVDLLSDQDDTDSAVAALLEAAAVQLDDQLQFTHRKTTEQTHIERPTRSVYFSVRTGTLTLRPSMKVDVVVSGHAPRGRVVTEPLDPPIHGACEIWPDVRMFPLEDHVAEKICAMYERHRKAGNTSTRYKDLADLAVIAQRTSFDGALLHAVLLEEVTRRRERGMVVELPARGFAVPTSDWRSGYETIAKKVRELPTELHSFGGVRALMDAFLAPLLRGEPPAGRWNPSSREWER
ncbi:MAG TPA: nucleotidyl transferase AbiEii/AbiGii toxin family protein [Streptomyces sp.]